MKKIIKEQNGLKICFDGRKYIVYYKNQVLLTYPSGEPTFIDEDMVIADKDTIYIYQNIREGILSTSIISKQGVVIAKPILYNNSIIVVFRNGIVQYDTNLNVLKKVNCDFNGIITEERIIDERYFTFVINTNNKLTKVYYDIENNYITQGSKEYGKMLIRS